MSHPGSSAVVVLFTAKSYMGFFMYYLTKLLCTGFSVGSWGDTVIVSAQWWLGMCVKSGRLVLVAPVTAVPLKPSVMDLLV